MVFSHCRTVFDATQMISRKIPGILGSAGVCRPGCGLRSGAHQQNQRQRHLGYNQCGPQPVASQVAAHAPPAVLERAVQVPARDL
jgi:hypothetical protein